jgi:predicted ATP-binding protein involved in virulence
MRLGAKQLVRRANSGAPTTFPVLAYYGTSRRWQSLETTKVEAKMKVPRFIAYRDWLDPASEQKRLFRWFKTNELAILENEEKRPLLEAVRAAIVAIIPEARKAFWDVDCDELTIELTKGGHAQRLPFHALSEGYRNVIGMAADIGYKMVTLNPHLLERVVVDTPGIVFIDAIDLHLHSNWQRHVVGDFLRVFPHVQFFATAYSQFIIESLAGSENALVWDVNTGQPRAVDTMSTDRIAVATLRD